MAPSKVRFGKADLPRRVAANLCKVGLPSVAVRLEFNEHRMTEWLGAAKVMNQRTGRPEVGRPAVFYGQKVGRIANPSYSRIASMPQLLRLALVLALVLAVPILPFALFGERIEEATEAWLGRPPGEAGGYHAARPADEVLFVAVVGLLSTDVFLPVPSSLVSTVAGMQLSLPLAITASWLGMTAGATLGFALARWLGRPLAARLASAEELARMEVYNDRWGPRVLVLFRALPVLAEASVLACGAMALSWPRFMAPVALSNLGIAAVYSVVGYYGRSQSPLVTMYVLIASIAIPVVATTMVRWLVPTESRRPDGSSSGD